MTAPTMTGPSRREQDTCVRLVVRYRLPDGNWQASCVLPTCWPGAAEKADDRADALRAAGHEVQILPVTPVL